MNKFNNEHTRRFIMSCIEDYLHRKDGAMSVIFAVVLVVTVSSIALAVDYGRQVRLEAAMQTALDAAVLAGSAVDLADENRLDRFNTMFAENFDIEESEEIGLDFTYSPQDGGHGTARRSIPATFSAIFGEDTLNVFVESYANAGVEDLEIVMVLDVSGSMLLNMGAQSRLEALKKAAKRLVSIIETKKNAGQSVKYAIVPFTMNVNVGTDNTAFVQNTNHSLFNGTAWAGCVLERPGSYAHDDTYNSNSGPTGGGSWHAYIWPPEPDKMNKCENQSDGTNNGYKTIEAVGSGGIYDGATLGPNYNCVRLPIVPLTNSASDIETEIDKLEAHGNQGTIIAPGVAWAHRVLSPAEPFDGGTAFGNARKIMIVITDGIQTTEGQGKGANCTTATNTSTAYSFDPATFGLDGDPISTFGPRDMFGPYGYIYDSAPTGAAKADWNVVDDVLHELSLDACKRYKDRDPGDGTVELYTIAASTNAGKGTRIYDLLKECATDEAHFFHVEDSDELKEAFEAIAKKATNLRLTQ